MLILAATVWLVTAWPAAAFDAASTVSAANTVDAANAASVMNTTNRDSWQGQILYYILVDRFADGDPSNNYGISVDDLRNFHGGDLQGVLDRLDYLKELGVTTIILSPIMESQARSYGGSQVVDFYKVDQHFGDLAKLREVVDKAHEMGMKVLLEMVFNHTGTDHPWYKDRLHLDWYHRVGEIRDWSNPWQVENGNLNGLPDLAQENPGVASYLLEAAGWWEEETGVDGFWLDNLQHVPLAFWEKLAQTVKSTRPGFVLFGEANAPSPAELTRYHQAGIDFLADYPLYYAIRDVFGKGRPMTRLSERLRQEDFHREAGMLGIFIDNSNLPRFLFEAGDQAKAKLRLALAFQMTFPGIPIAYYGDEVGMNGGREPYNRWDMVWENDPELREYYKTLIAARMANPALQRGNSAELFADEALFIFYRQFESNKVVVAFNNSGGERAGRFDVAAKTGLKDGALLANLLGTDLVAVQDGKLDLTFAGREVKILAVISQ
ncbi:MAG: alpha-amylase family glycosyl hydrolase [Syntrophothermus sp.]